MLTCSALYSNSASARAVLVHEKNTKMVRKREREREVNYTAWTIYSSVCVGNKTINRWTETSMSEVLEQPS